MVGQGSFIISQSQEIAQIFNSEILKEYALIWDIHPPAVPLVGAHAEVDRS